MDLKEYDVALSFLEDDIEIAKKIFIELNGKCKVFAYFEKQVDIVGTDGEKTFNEVFGKKSKVIIVLYRDKWGSTPWTRIEQTAVRNRGFDDGYDFVMFIKLDKTSTIPQWLPKTQIWGNFEEHGVEGSVSVIEAKIQSFSVELKEVNAITKAKIIDEKNQFNQKRDKFLHSREGVIQAFEELKKLISKVIEIAERIKQESKTINIFANSKDKEKDQLFLVINKIALCIEPVETLMHKIFNSLFTDVELNIQFLAIKRPNQDNVKKSFQCKFSYNEEMVYGWLLDNKFYRTDTLADHLIETALQIKDD